MITENLILYLIFYLNNFNSFNIFLKRKPLKTVYKEIIIKKRAFLFPAILSDNKSVNAMKPIKERQHKIMMIDNAILTILLFIFFILTKKSPNISKRGLWIYVYFYCKVKLTGNVKYEFTALPPFLPGFHLGIDLTTLVASLSHSGQSGTPLWIETWLIEPSCETTNFK